MKFVYEAPQHAYVDFLKQSSLPLTVRVTITEAIILTKTPKGIDLLC